MKEIELKILDINIHKIEDKLINIGAVKIGDNIITEKQYDFSDGRIINNKDLLRLRKIGNKNEIVYKDNKGSDKRFLSFIETQTEVTDFEIMDKILLKIGLQSVRYRQKRRISYKKNNTNFEIDKYPDIPPYLEIEGCKDNIIKYLNLLGYDISESSSMNSTEVLKYYNVDYNYQSF